MDWRRSSHDCDCLSPSPISHPVFPEVFALSFLAGDAFVIDHFGWSPLPTQLRSM